MPHTHRRPEQRQSPCRRRCQYRLRGRERPRSQGHQRHADRGCYRGEEQRRCSAGTPRHSQAAWFSEIGLTQSCRHHFNIELEVAPVKASYTEFLAARRTSVQPALPARVLPLVEHLADLESQVVYTNCMCGERRVWRRGSNGRADLPSHWGISYGIFKALRKISYKLAS